MTGFSLSGDGESLLYFWFAEDYETSDFPCQAVERQKAEEVLEVSAWAGTRAPRRGAHDGQAYRRSLCRIRREARLFQANVRYRVVRWSTASALSGSVLYRPFAETLARYLVGDPVWAKTFSSAHVRPLAKANSAGRRVAAAQLSGVMPPGIAAPWLADLARDGSPSVCAAARTALRDRGREVAAMSHRDLILASPKPLQWARLVKVIELVDPFSFGWETIPTSLEAIFDALPHEFLVDARKRRGRLLKKREDAAKKADRKFWTVSCRSLRAETGPSASGH